MNTNRIIAVLPSNEKHFSKVMDWNIYILLQKKSATGIRIFRGLVYFCKIYIDLLEHKNSGNFKKLLRLTFLHYCTDLGFIPKKKKCTSCLK